MAYAESLDVHASGAMRRQLDQQRWHFQHGPIDLLLAADGDGRAIKRALEGAWQQFAVLLSQLTVELKQLRQPLSTHTQFNGAVARRMAYACRPYLPQFVTPMAAVAGSVADELIQHFSREPAISRAYINNSGDIALHLQPGQQYQVGLFSDISRYRGTTSPLDADFTISDTLAVRGLATSGWRGRSFSLGIADSVTVLATTAASADVAATLIGNKVFVEHPAIHRAPANSLKDDTDLGEQLVVTHVGSLPRLVIEQALDNASKYAQPLVDSGRIYGAVIALQGQVRVVGLAQNKKEGYVKLN